MNPNQLSLFGLATSAKPVKPDLVKMRWSHSKINLVHQCNRAYFYRHYGSNKSTLNNPNYEHIHFLKSLSSQHLASGEIVHNIIASALRKAKQGEHWDEQRMISFARSQLTQSFNYSNALRGGARPAVDYPPLILREILFDSQDQPLLRRQIWEKIEANLLNYARSDRFAFFKQEASRSNALIEANLNFELPGVRVSGKIDLAFTWDDRYFIVDWKTGRKEVEETSLQLLTYALWAIEKQGITPTQILIQKAYLQEDTVEVLEFSDLHLSRARARIQQDAEVLRELDYFGKRGEIAAFTACNHEKVCQYCPYQTICERLN